MAVGPRTQRVFLVGHRSNNTAMISVRDAVSGRWVRTVGFGASTLPTAVAFGEQRRRVFVATEPCHAGANCLGDVVRPGALHVMDARTGVPLRSVAVGGGPEMAVVDDQTKRVFVVSPGFEARGAYEPGSVSVIDTQSWRVIRTTRIGRGTRGAVADTGTGRIFITNGADSSVDILDGTTGRLLRTVPVHGGAVNAAVDETSGRVFVSGNDQVAALDAVTGEPLHAAAVGNPIAMAVDEHIQRVFVHSAVLIGNGASQDSVSVLNATTGEVLHTTMLGTIPCCSPLGGGGIAVDSTRGRVFVAHAGPFGNLPANNVSVLDAVTGAVVQTVPVLPQPALVVVDEQAHRAFVSSDVGSADASAVTILDTRLARGQS